MINTTVRLDEIDYETRDPGMLVESIRVRGIAIPVHVNRVGDRYVCTDGHKRLSACAILAKEDEKYARIPVLLKNDYSKSGSSFWGNTQNRH
ncbi:MAG: ParB-like nuclease domain-containing protein [Solobacterium sp.]|nr:ParB-like nuclease domain-containing protein [Solobacterium sp.]